MSKLAFIGKNIDKPALIEHIKKCLYNEKEFQEECQNLRFDVGQEVTSARLARAPWKQGKIVAKMEIWSPGLPSPYNVQLWKGQKICVPMDNDAIVHPVEGR